jgi:hypothetical protein
MASATPSAPIVLKRVLPSEVKALALSPIDDKTLGQAAALMKEVREGGESALVGIAERFGDIQPGGNAIRFGCDGNRTAYLSGCMQVARIIWIRVN